jgi:DNA-binding NtrC family response regulator
MKRNIMFVDNSTSVLETLKWLLEDEPYYVFAFDDPIEALNLIGLTDFAVVVADQSMRKMSGLEFMQRVKQRSPDTVGIIMTDNMQLEKGTDAINQNDVYGFVKKPLNNGKIKHAVASALTYYDVNVASRQKKRPCQ